MKDVIYEKEIKNHNEIKKEMCELTLGDICDDELIEMLAKELVVRKKLEILKKSKNDNKKTMKIFVSNVVGNGLSKVRVENEEFMEKYL